MLKMQDSQTQSQEAALRLSSLTAQLTLQVTLSGKQREGAEAMTHFGWKPIAYSLLRFIFDNQHIYT